MNAHVMKMPSIEPRNHGLSVYVLEDDDFFADLILDVLADDPRVETVLRFSNALEASEFLEEDDWPDLFITDLSMPRAGGVRFLEFVRSSERRGEVRRNGHKDTRRGKSQPATPVVVLTNSDKATDYSHVIEGQANCFVTKPDTLPELRAVLKRVVRSTIWAVPLPSILSADDASESMSTVSMLSQVSEDGEIGASQAARSSYAI